MRSYVYAIRAMPDGPVKLGHSVNIEARLRQLQTGAHELLSVIWTAYGDVNTERKLHMIFANFRKRYEWFDLGDMSDERIKLALERALQVRSLTPIENLPEWLASWPQGM
jgi:hypothetical protein